MTSTLQTYNQLNNLKVKFFIFKVTFKIMVYVKKANFNPFLRYVTSLFFHKLNLIDLYPALDFFSLPF